MIAHLPIGGLQGGVGVMVLNAVVVKVLEVSTLEVLVVVAVVGVGVGVELASIRSCGWHGDLLVLVRQDHGSRSNFGKCSNLC